MTAPRGVVVTGGSTGIGYEVARRFGQAGDRVMITARTEENLHTARQQLAKEGIDVMTAVASVSDPADARGTAAQAVEAFGSIDVLVNNAGICYEASLLETPQSVWDELMATNLTGVFLMSREVARIMIEIGNGGVIINTSSINSSLVEPLYVPYSATKAAVDAITEGLAVELACHGDSSCRSATGLHRYAHVRKGPSRSRRAGSVAARGHQSRSPRTVRRTRGSCWRLLLSRLR